MPTYFHYHPTLLGDGSIIMPGNFGRLINSYRPNEMNNNVTRELVFELVRHNGYNNRPSRFDCAYAFQDLESAKTGALSLGSRDVLYEVELVDKEPMFLGSMSLVNTVSTITGAAFIPACTMIAQRYWAGLSVEGAPDVREVLTMSRMRVLRRVD